MIGARRGSPLAVGYGPNENILAQTHCLKSMTNKISYLDDGNCFVKKDQIEFFDSEGIKVNKKVMNLSKDELNYDKGDYKYFMEKEIDEQPLP